METIKGNKKINGKTALLKSKPKIEYAYKLYYLKDGKEIIIDEADHKEFLEQYKKDLKLKNEFKKVRLTIKKN